tara:strand:+ start:59 stop:469 length:411 start_codon:yes stop_codon:yes gene_type:complete
MKITKTQLRQIIKEEAEKILKEAYGDRYISSSFRDRKYRPPARGSAPGTSGRLPDETTKGAEELPDCLYDGNGKKLGGFMSHAKASGEGLVPGSRSSRCAMPRKGVAYVGKKAYEYDIFKGGLQKDDDGNPIPKKF